MECYHRKKIATLVSSFTQVLGIVDSLMEWARCNQTEFYKMLARLPREIKADVNTACSLAE
jgi:hypothetical protein